MKKTRDNIGLCVATPKSAALYPSPPPLPRKLVRKSVTESVTNQEISEFWKRKRIEEEDHLFAAIKSAARIRALNFSEEDYKCFIESLDDIDEDSNDNKDNEKNQHNKEIRIGVRDWWTKSKYAYLNQPAIGSNDLLKRRASNYVPNCFSFKPSAPLYPTSLGVF